MGEVFLAQTLARSVKLIGQTLDEQQAEDEFLELGRIHLPAKDVGGLEKEAFELGERDFIAGHSLSKLFCSQNGVSEA